MGAYIVTNMVKGRHLCMRGGGVREAFGSQRDNMKINPFTPGINTTIQ